MGQSAQLSVEYLFGIALINTKCIYIAQYVGKSIGNIFLKDDLISAKNKKNMMTYVHVPILGALPRIWGKAPRHVGQSAQGYFIIIWTSVVNSIKLIINIYNLQSNLLY